MKDSTPYSNHQISLRAPSLICPICNSRNISGSNIGQRAAATLGAGFGAIAGYYEETSGSELAPVSAAILNAFAGAVAGGVAGCALGKFIDEQILDNHQCLDCYHQF